MSRWWPDSLLVGLGDSQVEVIRGRRGAPASRQAQALIESFTTTSGGLPWSGALDALDEAVTRSGVRGATARMVLSNRWARYAVLPWHDDLNGRRDLEQLARLEFQRTYGAAADAWDVRVSDAPWGHPRLACAIDRGLIDGVLERLARQRVKAIGVRPLLMAAWNAARSRLGADATLVLLEPTRMCLARTERRRWRQVVVRRVNNHAARALDQELAALAGPDPDPPLVALLVGNDVQWPDGSAWAATHAARYSLARCAAM